MTGNGSGTKIWWVPKLVVACVLVAGVVLVLTGSRFPFWAAWW